MRNGLSTAGFSEFVHEVLDDPAEAYCEYRVHAQRSLQGGLFARTGPLLLGTIKSSRDFRVPIKLAGAAADEIDLDLPTPLDLALTGLGTCLVTTLVGGGGSTGAVFDAVKAHIDYIQAPAGSAGGGGARCDLRISGACDDQTMADLLRKSEMYSPNFMTAVEAVPIRAVIETQEDRRDFIHQEARFPAPSESSDQGCDVNWISGPQLESRPRRSGDLLSLRVDAPKQLTGVDWGPNPQEYLLMGLAAEVAGRLFDIAKGAGYPEQRWDVTATARLDMRGFFNSQPDAIVSMQDLTCAVTSPVSDSELVSGWVRQALIDSWVAALLTNEHQVTVTWKTEHLTDGELHDLSQSSFRPAVGE